MKTGRPDYHIPSPDTVSHDVRDVFVRVRKRIAKILQVKLVSLVFFFRLTGYRSRNMKGPSALQPTPGHPLTIKPTWL